MKSDMKENQRNRGVPSVFFASITSLLQQSLRNLAACDSRTDASAAVKYYGQQEDQHTTVPCRSGSQTWSMCTTWNICRAKQQLQLCVVKHPEKFSSTKDQYCCTLYFQPCALRSNSHCCCPLQCKNDLAELWWIKHLEEAGWWILAFFQGSLTFTPVQFTNCGHRWFIEPSCQGCAKLGTKSSQQRSGDASGQKTEKNARVQKEKGTKVWNLCCSFSLLWPMGDQCFQFNQSENPALGFPSRWKTWPTAKPWSGHD